MNVKQWQAECAYIARVTDGIARGGSVPDDFNGDRAVFIRYCKMQRNAATRDGRDDSAQYIQHCIDDVGDNA